MMAVIRHTGVRVPKSLAPKSLAEAGRSAQWPQWLEALKKECGDFLSQGVFDEVDRGAVLVATMVVPTQLLLNTRADGTFKFRIVVRGDLAVRGEHYLGTRSPMVSLDTTHITVAMAAGSETPSFSTDCSQAFLNADLGHPNFLCD